MKKSFLWIICVLALALLVLPAYATESDIPRVDNTKHVHDLAQVLDAQRAQELEAKAAELSQRSGGAIVIVVTQSNYSAGDIGSFAQKFYLENRFDRVYDHGGIILYYNYDTHSYGINSFSDTGQFPWPKDVFQNTVNTIQTYLEQQYGVSNSFIQGLNVLEDAVTQVEADRAIEEQGFLVDSSIYVHDFSDNLTAAQLSALDAQAKQVSQVLGAPAVVVVTNTNFGENDIRSLATEFYEQNKFGKIDGKEGVIIGFNMAESLYEFVVFEDSFGVFTDRDIDLVLDEMYLPLTQGFGLFEALTVGLNTIEDLSHQYEIILQQQRDDGYFLTDTQEYVHDLAKILSEDEHSHLEKKAQELSQRLRAPVVFVVTESIYNKANIQQFAEDFFEDNNFNESLPKKGVSLGLDVDHEEFQLVVFEGSFSVFPDETIAEIVDEMSAVAQENRDSFAILETGQQGIEKAITHYEKTTVPVAEKEAFVYDFGHGLSGTTMDNLSAATQTLSQRYGTSIKYVVVDEYHGEKNIAALADAFYAENNVHWDSEASHLIIMVHRDEKELCAKEFSTGTPMFSKKDLRIIEHLMEKEIAPVAPLDAGELGDVMLSAIEQQQEEQVTFNGLIAKPALKRGFPAILMFSSVISFIVLRKVRKKHHLTLESPDLVDYVYQPAVYFSPSNRQLMDSKTRRRMRLYNQKNTTSSGGSSSRDSKPSSTSSVSNSKTSRGSNVKSSGSSYGSSSSSTTTKGKSSSGGSTRGGGRSF